MGNIVLVGAGGTGMSGVAGMLRELGFTNLVCIDGAHSQLTDRLLHMGMKVIIGHGKYKVSSDDVVIYSAAAEQSPEVQQAFSYPHDGKSLCIVWNYFEFLGELSKYFSTIAITGTNGKSSTTALALYVANSVLPNFGIGILGALASDLGENNYILSASCKSDIREIFLAIFSKQELSNQELIKKYIFILEACEYKRHFLHLDVDYALVTSLSCDHLDYYKDEADYFSAFEELFFCVKNQVFLLDIYRSYLEKNIKNSILFEKFFFVHSEEVAFEHLFGVWHQWNASLILAIFVHVFSLEASVLKQKMRNFSGLRRRMECLGKVTGGAVVYSDYGHMADPILMGYQALKQKYPDKNIVVCFQPHQLRRVVTEWDAFIEILRKYDQCFIYDIYAARESVQDYQQFLGFQGVSDFSLNHVGHFFAEKCGGIYIEEFEDLWSRVSELADDTVLVVYSAGDVDYLLREKLKH